MSAESDQTEFETLLATYAQAVKDVVRTRRVYELIPGAVERARREKRAAHEALIQWYVRTVRGAKAAT